ncbi:6-phosphogluconolactonase [Dactylellina cionopaga]|nr:6-phosphogluconolactonase [Dactylellina cionopaga]
MAPQQIFIGGYDHAIDSFIFDEAAGTLTKTHTSFESSPGPSWQHIVPEHQLLFSGCEGPEGGIGYLDSYKIGEDGSLTKVDRKECVQGCVSMDMGKNGFLVTASYDASGVNTYYTKETGEIVPLQKLMFTLPDGQAGHPDIDPVRQDAAHPHESRIDPTGNFLLIPDLGSDYLRIFKITYGEKGEDTRIEEVEPLKCDTRAGPRHCYFDRTGKFMYLVEELASMVRVYQVEYTGPRGIDFTPIQRISSLGLGKGPADTRVQKLKAAEVAISVGFWPVGWYKS